MAARVTCLEPCTLAHEYFQQAVTAQKLRREISAPCGERGVCSAKSTLLLSVAPLDPQLSCHPESQDATPLDKAARGNQPVHQARLLPSHRCGPFKHPVPPTPCSTLSLSTSNPLAERTLPEVGTAALRDEPTKLLRSAEAIFPVQGRVSAKCKL